MNQFDLVGRTAVVTGGAQGIGYAVAQRMLESGAKVALWDADASVLENAVAALSAQGQVLALQCDVRSQEQVENATARTHAHFGSIDILVHSAGISGPNAPLVDYSVTEWNRIVDINLNGAFLVNQAVVKRMIAAEYGRIVNIASIAGKEGNPNAAAYSAAKAGLIAMTKSLGKETASHDIAVNVITPTAAKTRIFDQLTQEHIDYMLGKIPRARFLKLEEIASMVCWLTSQENSFTTGAVFDLSGGRATY